jgi:hypothetical protein
VDGGPEGGDNVKPEDGYRKSRHEQHADRQELGNYHPCESALGGHSATEANPDHGPRVDLANHLTEGDLEEGPVAQDLKAAAGRSGHGSDGHQSQ